MAAGGVQPEAVRKLRATAEAALEAQLPSGGEHHVSTCRRSLSWCWMRIAPVAAAHQRNAPRTRTRRHVCLRGDCPAMPSTMPIHGSAARPGPLHAVLQQLSGVQRAGAGERCDGTAAAPHVRGKPGEGGGLLFACRRKGTKCSDGGVCMHAFKRSHGLHACRLHMQHHPHAVFALMPHACSVHTCGCACTGQSGMGARNLTRVPRL